MMEYDKPFRTYNELIVKMESKGIIVKDKDFAKEVLSNCSYYNLINRYKNVFTNHTNGDKFRENTTFEEIYTVYTLDTALSSILLKYILYIERSLKSKLSYIVAEQYGVSDESINDGATKVCSYLDRSNYSNSHNLRDTTLKSISGVLNYSKGATNKKVYISSSLKHYVKHHNHVPPWILVTSLSFGVTKQWYSILRATDKTRVVNSFIGSSSLTDEEKKEYLKTSIDLIRNYRNAIAHGGKTTGISVKRIPKKQSILLSNGLISEEDFRNGSITHSGVQTVICILLSLINDHYIENALIQDIMNLFWPYKVNDNDRFGKGIWDDLGLSGKFLNELIKIYKGE